MATSLKMFPSETLLVIAKSFDDLPSLYAFAQA